MFGDVDDSEEANNNGMRASNAMGLVNNGTCALKDLAVVAPLGAVLDLELASPMASLTETSSVVVQIKIADECPPGNAYLAGSRVCEPCPANKYMLTFLPMAECQTCPDGATCAGGDAGLSTKSGWWRASFHSDEMWPCPMDQNCLGGTETEAVACREGSRGPLCGVCVAGFFSNGRRCEYCSSSASHDAFYTIIALVVALCAGATWKVYRHAHDPKTWYRSVVSILASIVDVQRAKIAWTTIQITTGRYNQSFPKKSAFFLLASHLCLVFREQRLLGRLTSNGPNRLSRCQLY